MLNYRVDIGGLPGCSPERIEIGAIPTNAARPGSVRPAVDPSGSQTERSGPQPAGRATLRQMKGRLLSLALAALLTPVLLKADVRGARKTFLRRRVAGAAGRLGE